MKIKFLGTAAAEGVPAVFCNCPTCAKARALGGKNVRTRSQILIDNDTLFDFPMDTYMHMLAHKLDLSAIKRVLITHAHMDHCYPQEFCMRGAPFAHAMTEPNIEIICNATVRDLFAEDTSREMKESIARTVMLTVLQPFDTLERDGMRITALPASHTVGEQCLVYYLERGGVGALFLNDTGTLEKQVYSRLKDSGAKVRFVALDCTYGAKRHGPGRHMGLYDICDQAEIMKSVGLLTSDACIYATHLSHNTDLDYDGIFALATPLGIAVAYDGCEVDLRGISE